MKERGAGAFKRLCVALALLLLILPILPIAPAQSASDPWWGPTEKARPTSGWAIRVPVTVENKFDYVLTDPFVAVELDYGKLLVAAGWTNQTVGTEVRPRGFTLDVDSIRVVPYNHGFVTGPEGGPTAGAIPHVFYPSLLEAPKFKEFDATRNPAGTIMFQIDGSFFPQQKREFYIYANPLEYGKTPAPTFDPLVKSPLDAYLWGTAGTTTYGYEPNQPGQAHRLQIYARADGITKVTVSTFELGRFVPVASTPTFPNPFTLSSGGTGRAFFIPAGKPYKIESDRPVQVFAAGQQGGATSTKEAAGFVPGWSGSFADDAFTLYEARDAGSQPTVRIVLAGTGSGTVTVSSTTSPPDSKTLTASSPTAVLKVNGQGFTTIQGNGKFLVSNVARGQNAPIEDDIPFYTMQVPATSGSPSGTDFYTFLMNDAGWFRVCASSNVSARILDTSLGNLQIYPEGTYPNAPPATFAKSTFCEQVPVPRAAGTTREYNFFSTTEGLPAGTQKQPFRLMVGADARLMPDLDVNNTRSFYGPYGGLAGVDYLLYKETGLFGHYNDTRITIFEEKERTDGTLFVVNRTRALQRDEYLALIPDAAGSSTGRFHVVATKPISAFSLAPVTYKRTDSTVDPPQPVDETIPYLFAVPGRPVSPSVTIGGAEFRGPLVEIRSSETDARQLFRSTGPGSPLAFRLDVLNLGRWVGNEDLTDTITVSCSTPAGWTVDGCSKEVTLGSRSAERLNVVVTPSADDVNATRTILVEARSKSGGIAATFKLIVFVEIRYGVGMWFDLEGGRKTIDPPIGLTPGETHRYTIVLKNTGSTQDTFNLAAEDPREGWTQSLELDGDPVTSVRLDGGESALLDFVVKAPNQETAPQNIVSITARSVSNALAADVVNSATRIRPKVDLELTLDPQTRLAEPNETVVFNVSTRNKGNDVFTVIFNQDSILPRGWDARLSVPEITLNPNPGNDPTLNFVLQLFVTPPEGARAGDLASVKLAADIDTGGAGGRVPGDEISAVVVVRRVYNLTTPPLADTDALPGATLRYVLPVTNRGNGQVNLEILPGAVEAALVSDNGDERPMPGWNVVVDGADITLDLNETVDLVLRVSVPPAAPPGLYNVSFTTRLSREALQNLTLPIAVKTLSRVEYVGAKSVGLVPGRPVTLPYVARNTGNVAGIFDFTADVPAGWSANVSPPRARLSPGEQVDVTVTLNATRDATNGDYRVTLSSQAPGAAASPTPLSVNLARPQLYIAGVEGTGALRAGELVLVTATIGNRAGIEASNVSVALVVDGNVVDRVLLSRIPVGTTSVATMSWVATQRGGDVKVVLDPDQEISVPTRDEMTQGVNFGSRVGLPAPGPVAIIAAVGILALLRSPTLSRDDATTRRRGEEGRAVVSSRQPKEREDP